MKPLGLKGVYESLRSASGTAQHLLLSVWGIIAAVGFYAVGISNLHLIVWIASSLFVLYCTVWRGKVCLLWALRLDVMITAIVLAEYLYIEWDTGINTVVFFLGRLAAGVILLLHGLYLSNLVRRQILEHKKFESILEVEFTSEIR
jgi:hypothetical protein